MGAIFCRPDSSRQRSGDLFCSRMKTSSSCPKLWSSACAGKSFPPAVLVTAMYHHQVQQALHCGDLRWENNTHWKLSAYRVSGSGVMISRRSCLLRPLGMIRHWSFHLRSIPSRCRLWHHVSLTAITVAMAGTHGTSFQYGASAVQKRRSWLRCLVWAAACGCYCASRTWIHSKT